LIGSEAVVAYLDRCAYLSNNTWKGWLRS